MGSARCWVLGLIPPPATGGLKGTLVDNFDKSGKRLLRPRVNRSQARARGYPGSLPSSPETWSNLSYHQHGGRARCTLPDKTKTSQDQADQVSAAQVPKEMLRWSSACGNHLLHNGVMLRSLAKEVTSCRMPWGTLGCNA